MTRSGHLDDLPANALPVTLWNLLQAWLVAQPVTRTRKRRRRREEDVPLPFERPA